ncbi:reverse transcriptase family protein [Microbacterium sp. NPDC057944]|uniref:reverse transcriptase family protein n=1 Tax=Microbacterium sp. NPDC057944 TaxID=3346286 RepID=UPI0036D8DB38
MSHAPHLSRVIASQHGLDPDSTSAYIRRLEILRATGSPALLTLNHLALSANVDWAELRGIVRRSSAPYRPIRIRKKSGGHRDLLSPNDELLKVQRWVLDNILVHSPRHPDSFAYFEKVTTRECAERHVGATWMLKTDLHDFFPSVTERQVYRVFLELGYSPLLSFELARLCTWPNQRTSVASLSPNDTRPYARTVEGVLPQGAPTSGALANAVSRGLDRGLSRLALRHGLVYTRYSDDITLSGSGSFSRKYAAALIPKVRAIVERSGFNLHQKKTRIIPPGARKLVLGIMVTESGLAIMPEQKRRVDLYIHSVAKYGPVEFAKHRKFESALAMINHVEGWLAYLYHIDAAWTRTRSVKWFKALESHQVFSAALA